jgi:hypothetical protein
MSRKHLVEVIGALVIAVGLGFALGMVLPRRPQY